MAVKKRKLPINPEILVWARRRAGYEINEAAKKINVASSRLDSWEKGDSSPTVRQGRQLAKLYDRHFLEFIGSEIPVLPQIELVPDYRFHPEKSSASDRRILEKVQEWAEAQRANALSLIEDLDEQPTVFPKNLSSGTSQDAEAAAKKIKKAMSAQFNERDHLPASKRPPLPSFLQTVIEQMGVLVLKNTKLDKCNARGICLYAQPLPIIVLRNEAPTAQAFTLMHEFGHIIINNSAVSGAAGLHKTTSTNSGKRIENWCNKFAAAFLIPSTELEKHAPRPSRPEENFDLDKLENLAKSFCVSKHAMLIRLVSLGYVVQQFYWQNMHTELITQETRSFDRSPYYGKRFVNNHGRFYTGLVLEAWDAGLITNHNAAEYLGIKNLQHLYNQISSP